MNQENIQDIYEETKNIEYISIPIKCYSKKG